MNRKKIASVIFFIALFLLTIYVVFGNNDLGEIGAVIGTMEPGWVALAVFLALAYVAGEGLIIFYLLRVLGCRAPALRCMCYSFIGFFFSGITPSATGGQPMQLYYMSKDKIHLADSTVVLMTVAVAYKFVLVCVGLALPLFFFSVLNAHLGSYWALYALGLSLNVIVVILLLIIMISPNLFRRIVTGVEALLVRLHVLKHNTSRLDKLEALAEDYHVAVLFFMAHKACMLKVVLMTMAQRCTQFFITWAIYRALGLSGTSWVDIVVLQAAIYTAVDMLPLPGAQGISEVMYKSVYASVFTGVSLIASVSASRGISFYLVLIISGLIYAAQVAGLRLPGEKKRGEMYDG